MSAERWKKIESCLKQRRRSLPISGPRFLTGNVRTIRGFVPKWICCAPHG